VDGECPRALQEPDMTYVDHAPSRQITGVVAVIAIHAALVLALMNGLVSRIQPEIEKIIQVVDVPIAEEPQEPVPVPQPDKFVPDVQVPVEIPLPPIEVESDPIELPPMDVTTDAEPTRSAINEPSPLQVDPRKGLTKPDYPATSIRQNEQGKVLLLIYVLPNGKVGDVKVSRSSGYPRLDASAMREARESWRFLPAKDGSGQAVAAWGTFEVAFELNN
jgi:protein TonB